MSIVMISLGDHCEVRTRGPRRESASDPVSLKHVPDHYRHENTAGVNSWRCVYPKACPFFLE